MSPCDWYKLPDGKGAVVCSRGRRSRRRCAICGDWADLLCDGKREDGRTCDQPIRRRCAVHRGRNLDYCPSCAKVIDTEQQCSPGPASSACGRLRSIAPSPQKKGEV